ncbi:hypothetical protein [Marinicauda salina]|uniref:hypothetical protein n=1 Tax=Marinicauda salina TaxID=2135793 RepID=UPI0011B2938F|nr:hypothetical protein [Marinicauda salina]
MRKVYTEKCSTPLASLWCDWWRYFGIAVASVVFGAVVSFVISNWCWVALVVVIYFVIVLVLVICPIRRRDWTPNGSSRADEAADGLRAALLAIAIAATGFMVDATIGEESPIGSGWVVSPFALSAVVTLFSWMLQKKKALARSAFGGRGIRSASLQNPLLRNETYDLLAFSLIVFGAAWVVTATLASA